MHQLLWLLLSVLLLLPGQDAAPTAIVKYQAGMTFDTTMPGLVEQLADELAQHNITLQPTDDDPNISLTAERECASGDCIHFQIRLHTPERLTPSDALLALDTSPTFFLYFPPLNDAAQRQLVEAAAGLSLYSIGRCDLAQDYLQPMPYHQESPTGWPYEVPPYTLPFYAGNCALLADDFPRTIDAFESALVLDDGGTLLNSAPALNLIWTYMQTGQAEAAADLLHSDRLAQAADADHPTVLLSRARLLALAFDYDAAIVTLDHAIHRAMNSGPIDRQQLARLFVARGQLYLLLYEWDRVLHDYNAALRLMPGYADAHYQRGLLYLSILQTGQQLRQAALNDFTRYLELAPDGDHAAAARRYIESIRAELDASE